MRVVTGDRRQETGDKFGPQLSWPLSPVSCLLLIGVLLLVPIFAHGCHGDDVDHEPGAVPRVEREPDRSPPGRG